LPGKRLSGIFTLNVEHFTMPPNRLIRNEMTKESSTISTENSARPSSAVGQILLLSSEAAQAASISRILSAQNLPVLSCPSPEQAMETLAADSAKNPRINLVLLDAGPNGKHLFTWLREVLEDLLAPLVLLWNSDRVQIPIVLMTDPPHVSQAVQALQMGAYDYLLKPFSADQLIATVRRTLQYRRLQTQNDLFRHHLEQLISARTEMLQHSMRQLENSYDVTLEALGNALDLKDAETEGHSKRVTAYTLALGRAVGLGEPQLRVVGRGAFLHDIGKMAIPDAILRKPAKLTLEERAVMRTHTELGYQMIRKIPYLQEAAEIVYSHQEHFDGSGYPRGLRGEEIHIGARIFAVADTFDAITSNRPYRKANTMDAARKEILRCAGTQFDPSIVDVFVATPDSIWLDLREGIMRDGFAFSPFGYTFGEIP
jgi:putative nucleotidyltransferase with HDIG domain